MRFSHFARIALAATLLPTLLTPSAHAWGRDGHMLINRLAAQIEFARFAFAIYDVGRGGIGRNAGTQRPQRRIAREELGRILGLRAAPISHIISRWPRSMAQYNVGHPRRVEAIRGRVASIPGLHLAGNAYEGIGIPDCIRTGRPSLRQFDERPIEEVGPLEDRLLVEG